VIRYNCLVTDRSILNLGTSTAKGIRPTEYNRSIVMSPVRGFRLGSMRLVCPLEYRLEVWHRAIESVAMAEPKRKLLRPEGLVADPDQETDGCPTTRWSSLTILARYFSGNGRDCCASKIVGLSRRNLSAISFSNLALASSPRRK
jgi:hypothetical protein